MPLLNGFLIAVALVLVAYLALSKRLANSTSWRATITPLASIMGSGFLISAPLLAGSVGNLAVICMAILLVLAFMVGGAIRFNIRYFEPIENDNHGIAQDVDFLSRIVLSGAYFIAITYYLQILAAFVLKIFGTSNTTIANIITTSLLLIIGGVGMWRGLKELEAVEKYTIGLNLGIIGALIIGLVIYNAKLWFGGNWELASVSSQIDFHDLRMLLGLLIVVQGFETSRYLGDEHPAEERITTMRNAQIISTVIYLAFISLMTVLFHDGLAADVTAIIGMLKPVAVVLPIMVVIAAASSQFSAAVADSSGTGGLLEEITHRRLSVRYAYMLILFVTVALTWATDVNEIIAYASRAFALYYMLQCSVAFFVAWQQRDRSGRALRLAYFAFLTVVCCLVFLLGIPSE